MAILFAHEGSTVAIGDLTKDVREGGEPIRSLIDDAGGTVYFHRCDGVRWDDIDALVIRTVAVFGKLDVIVNISSRHGMVCAPGEIACGTGKAAAAGITKQVAVDYA